MTVTLAFLDVANADCAIVLPGSGEAVVVDIGDALRAEQWLRSASVTVIGGIYLTHEHDDHAPNLEKLDAFLSRWPPGSFRFLRGPEALAGTWIAEIKRLQAQGKATRVQRLMEALQRVSERDRKSDPIILGPGRGEAPHRDGDLVVEVLHPSALFLHAQPDRQPSPNEASMVVRVSYGRFAALLLGDLDGRGIEECLLLAKNDPGRVSAHLVKIPHHGAWPRSGKASRALTALLSSVRPEFAVLSVGSTNTYGHVAPELFSCLIELKQRHGLRFVCTEATQTCLLPEAQRDGRGLPVQRCAGDVTVMAEATGVWTHTTAAGDHAAKVRTILHAACDGRAALPPPPRGT